jgi:hypothetical protein
MSCTIITAFYPIKSKFPLEKYIEWATTYMRLESPIVLFTTPELKDKFKILRDIRPIYIIEQEFESLYTWSNYSHFWKNHYELDHEKNIHSPELYSIWAEKAFFVKRAIEINPYKTNYFFWCDIGAFRNQNIPQIILKSFPTTKYLPTNKIILCSIEPLNMNDTIIHNDGIIGNFTDKNRIVGGLWGGDIIGCINWCKAYDKMLIKYFENNRFAGKDQSIMLSTYLNNKELAVIVKSFNNLCDEWFFFEYLHSNLENIPYIIDISYL